MLLGMFALLHAFAQAGPTHEAAESGDEALLAQLLAAGTAPDERTLELQVTALHIAARHGHTALMAKLLAAGADPNSVDTQGWTALHVACQRDRSEAVRVLLDHGANDRGPWRHSLAGRSIVYGSSRMKGPPVERP